MSQGPLVVLYQIGAVNAIEMVMPPTGEEGGCSMRRLALSSPSNWFPRRCVALGRCRY